MNVVQQFNHEVNVNLLNSDVSRVTYCAMSVKPQEAVA